MVANLTRRHIPARRLAAVAVVVIAGLSSSMACSTGGSSPPNGAAPPAPAQPQPLPVDAIEAEYAVGIRHITLVDESRPTVADPEQGFPGADTRTLDVAVLYPAAGDAAEGPAVDGADPAVGPFPVIVYSHGFTDSIDLFAHLLTEWASAGYVVLAPAFPLTGPNSPGMPADPIGFSDVVNQPGDVSFVLTSLIDGSGDAAFIRPSIDPDRVGAAGHSLGAVTTLGLVYNSCCVDDRIDAALVSAGRPDVPFPGEWEWPPTPLLLIHGDADTIVDYSGSESSYEQATGAVYFLTLTRATHPDGILNPKYNGFTDLAAVAFFDAYLADDPSELDALPAEIENSRVGTWEQRSGPG